MKPMPSVARRVAAPKRFVPPFENGDRMDQPTFHALYEKTPHGFKAELIGGVVHMPSPVSKLHGRPHRVLAQWLGGYSDDTPGTDAFLDTTAVMAEDSEPQPDLSLLLEPEAGGQTRENNRGYLTGSPELAVEIANSSVAIDLHGKKRDYEAYGVREYIVVVVPTRVVHFFHRGKGGFKEMKPDAAGVLKSKVFPGLWLQADAVLDRSAKRLLATLQLGLASAEHAKFAARLAKKLG